MAGQGARVVGQLFRLEPDPTPERPTRWKVLDMRRVPRSWRPWRGAPPRVVLIGWIWSAGSGAFVEWSWQDLDGTTGPAIPGLGLERNDAIEALLLHQQERPPRHAGARLS